MSAVTTYSFNWNQIVRQDGKNLYRFILREVKNSNDAHDLLQSTYLSALQNAHQFRGDAQPSTWLHSIAPNLILNFKSRSAQYRYRFDCIDDYADTLSNGEDTSTRYEQQQRCLKVIELLSNSPSEIQETAWQIMFEEQSYEDTAQALSIPVGTVRSRLSRVRQKLLQNENARLSSWKFRPILMIKN